MAMFIAILGCTWPTGCRLDICPILYSAAGAAPKLIFTHEAVILMQNNPILLCLSLLAFVLNQGVTAFEVMLPGLFPRLIIPYIKFRMGVKWKGGCKSTRRGNVFAVGNYGPSVVLNLSHLFTSPEDFFNKQVELKYTEEGKRLPFSIVQ